MVAGLVDERTWLIQQMTWNAIERERNPPVEALRRDC
jgi:hypothetical protein